MQQPSPNRFQILSLDGGGMRGLFSALLLAKWEENLGHSITDHFDLIVGTSTGGIIALGLGMGLAPREIVEFYKKRGGDIFPGGLGKPWRWARQWFGTKFKANGLQDSLEDVFGARLLVLTCNS